MKAKKVISVSVLMAVCVNCSFICSCSKDDTEEQNPLENSGGNSSDLTGETNGHKWVNLGLPSGTLWATCNVGASAPEEYGIYFAWGETDGYDSGKTDCKTDFSWTTYKYSNGSSNLLTKYCPTGSSGFNGYTDSNTELQAGDDAASENWGGSWQTPSLAQAQELLNGDYTIVTLAAQNGVTGRLVTSKSNGKSIFLPAAGSYHGTSLDEVGSCGHYWLRSLYTGYPGSACSLYFGAYAVTTNNYYYRYIGRSVRPVRK